MANTINPNSFFNQEDGGTASSALSLAQKTFNITETIKEQVNVLIGNLDAFKIEYNEYNTENTTNISKIFNDYSTLTERVDNVSDDVDAVSKVFFDFKGSQEQEKKESAIQSEKEAESERDKAWEERDKQQKTREEKTGGGGGGAAAPNSVLAANDGFVKDGTEKKRGFWGGLGRGLIAPFTGLMHATAAAGGALTHGIQGGLDWLTGGRTDFDGEGGKKTDIPGTKMFRGLKNMFGRGDENRRGRGGILEPISSDVNDMANMDGEKVTGDKKGKGLFGGLFGRKLKDKKGEDADTKAIGNLNERLVAIENEAGLKKENKGLFGGLFGGKKEDGGDPIKKSVEKKKGGLFGGLFGKKEDKDTKEEKGRERVVYRGDAGKLTLIKGTGVDALSKEEAKSEFLRIKNEKKRTMNCLARGESEILPVRTK